MAQDNRIKPAGVRKLVAPTPVEEKPNVNTGKFRAVSVKYSKRLGPKSIQRFLEVAQRAAEWL